MREYIRQIRATAAAKDDFLASLHRQSARFEADYGIPVEVQVNGDFGEEALEPEARVELLSIIQEALTNVGKHAGADRVRVSLAIREQRVRLVIEDNGCGFDLEQVVIRGGNCFGLGVMRERAAAAGGNLEVHSAPGGGTSIVASIPVEPRFRK